MISTAPHRTQVKTIKFLTQIFNLSEVDSCQKSTRKKLGKKEAEAGKKIRIGRRRTERGKG